MTLLGSPLSSPSQSRPSSPSPLPPAAAKPSPAVTADIPEDIFEGVGGLVTESGPSAPGPAAGPDSCVKVSTESTESGTGTPACCLRPISPPPKRGATATFLPGLVPLPGVGVQSSSSIPRPTSLPAFLVPDRKEEETHQPDSSLPPLVRARVLASSNKTGSP